MKSLEVFFYLHTNALDRWFLTKDLQIFYASQGLLGSCLQFLGVGHVWQACIIMEVLEMIRSIHWQRERKMFPQRNRRVLWQKKQGLGEIHEDGD